MLHREQVVTRADAGTAIHDCLRRCAAVEDALEFGAKTLCRQQRAVVGDIQLVVVIGGAGNVTGDAIERVSADTRSVEESA